MERFKLDDNKLESYSSSHINETEKYLATFKVNRAGYIPHEVELRKRIDEYIFTASFPGAAIEHLNKNQFIVSIALSRKLNMID